MPEREKTFIPLIAVDCYGAQPSNKLQRPTQVNIQSQNGQVFIGCEFTYKHELPRPILPRGTEEPIDNYVVFCMAPYRRNLFESNLSSIRSQILNDLSVDDSIDVNVMSDEIIRRNNLCFRKHPV
jgi:hypothetical protein